MPTTHHQGLVWIFRDDPRLVFDLLRSLFAIELPALVNLRDRKGELDRFNPCFGDSGELRPDLALSADPAEGPAHEGIAVVVEVQGLIKRIKRFRLWTYWALLAELLERSTAVLMIPLEDSVSRWARGLGALEYPPREALLVLDRQNMPRIASIDEARRRPSMALLSAMIHGPNGDLEVFSVGLRVALEFTDARRWRYASCLLSVLPDEQRQIFIGALTMNERHQLSQAERRSVAFHDGRREGKLEGKLEALLTILELRKLPLSAADRRRLEACEDSERLDRWILDAMQARDLRELFEGS